MPEVAAETAPDNGRSTLWHNVAVRLADEGVPILAISRSLMLPVDEIREVLGSAVDRGTIINIPRGDWAPGTRRDERNPNTIPLEYNDEQLTMLAMRTFSLTASEAKLFVALLRRPEMTKKSLHLVLQPDDTSDEELTDIKIVDVYVCKIRKKITHRNYKLLIDTIWGRGYSMSKDVKDKAFTLMGLPHLAGGGRVGGDRG